MTLNTDTQRITKPGILIVDDDRTVIMALHKALSPIATVRFADSGRGALQLIQDKTPALILLDMNLPDMTGLTLCSELKAIAETADVPVLFITSQTDLSVEEKVFDVGAADFIVKPLNPRVVVARVQTHLAYRSALQLLSAQAYSDGLTGINNRRHFDEHLDKEFKRAQRQKSPITVMMIDVDEFKKFNDHYGHLAGDDCLKQLANALRACAKRPADFVARYGGEEFALILPDTDEAGAIALANELLTAIERLQIAQAPNAMRAHVTISIGLCSHLPLSEDLEDMGANALVLAADQALYQAKSNGRNGYSAKSGIA